jgi:pimeloyl-ACP methyl ester carboxylesterase
MKPLSCGYAAANGVKLYHEIYGDGEPLVLIHGGLTTIGQMQKWVEPLAETQRGFDAGPSHRIPAAQAAQRAGHAASSSPVCSDSASS